LKRGFRWDKKYLYWGITAFCVVACAILFYMALNYISVLGNALKKLMGILSPFLWGIVISYLLHPCMNSLERKAFIPMCRKLYKNNKKSDGSKLARGLSVFVSEIVLLVILASLVYLIIPQLYQSLETIVKNSNTYIDNITKWAEKMLQDYPEIEQYALNVLGSVNTSLMDWIQTKVLPELGSLVTNVTAGVYYVVMAIYNLIIGIIVSVYIMANHETFSANSKRWLYSIFSVETARRIRRALVFIDKTFAGFINGKLVDSAIIGLICYIGCALLRMPYALLVSVIVGVTNVIPFFGPFIGAVPSALIILLVSPIKCLIFVIFIIILQQLDGNVIGPKILGSSIGINGFWVMFSIIIGGGLFGFWGMLLGVPVFVVIYTAINEVIDKKLKRNDLPYETEDYIGVDYIDPVTYERVKKPYYATQEESAAQKKAEESDAQDENK
jgi:predicted PurR-regulated permease PerM